jgi:hypothetical protein
MPVVRRSAKRSVISKETARLRSVIAPLSTREERRAIEAAKAHLSKELSPRYRVFGAQLRIEKPAKPATISNRTIAVLILDYEKRRALEAIVSADGKVLRVLDLQGFQPAFLDDEVKEARAIAARDERVARIGKVRGSFVSTFAPHQDNSPRRRQVGLRYAAPDARLGIRLLAEAAVDLVDRRLIHFDEFPRPAQKGG